MFTEKRIEVLTLLASQAAISIENARLYADLHEARDEYQALYENAIEGLFQLSPQGELVQANPTLAKILGFDDVETMTAEYRDLLDHIFLSREAAGEFISALEERSVVSAFEAQGVTRGGRVFWMSLTAQLHENHQPSTGAGTGAMIDGSLIDISERKEREEADKQREVAEAATEAKSEFLANMSHEIRTPMNAILGFSKLALESNLDRKQHEYLTSIRNAAENLLNLVSDVLDFSKIEAGKLILESEPFPFSDSLTEVQRLFRTELRKKQLQLVIDNHAPRHPQYPADDILVGDGMRLQQVLVNLVGNAIKFTDNGEIRLQASVREAVDSQLLLQIDVQDSGIGISAEQQERLFNSFEQAEGSITRRYGGTGLGLAICKQLVEAMGGTIRVQSAPSEGSVFSFTMRCGLPDENSSAPNPTPRKRAAKPHILNGRHLLVAEDNPINQQLALEFLQRGGATVDIADNGRIAVAMCTQNHYDAVLMDIHMPEMDGIEATTQIRADENNPNHQSPIIALTAAALLDEKNRALKVGMNDFLTKPFAPAQLKNTILKWVKPEGNSSDLKVEVPVIQTKEEVIKLDLSYLEGLSRGDATFMKDMIGIFLKEIPLATQQMLGNFEEKDYKSIVNTAHRIKSNYMMLGMTTQQKIALSVEKMIKLEAIDEEQLLVMLQQLKNDSNLIYPLLEKKLALFN